MEEKSNITGDSGGEESDNFNVDGDRRGESGKIDDGNTKDDDVVNDIRKGKKKVNAKMKKDISRKEKEGRNIAKKIKKNENRKAAGLDNSGDNKNTADDFDKNSDGLLDIRDGDFKYKRIPDKKITVIQENNKIDDIRQDAEIKIPNLAPSEESSKGFLGFGAEATNYIAKGVLIFIVIIIFILYKVRTKDRHGNVLKRFP